MLEFEILRLNDNSSVLNLWPRVIKSRFKINIANKNKCNSDAYIICDTTYSGLYRLGLLLGNCTEIHNMV